MNCKNCEILLIEESDYCNKCGAKVIHNRLTLKGLIREFTRKFFNIDSTFLRTFLTMFTKPEEVINGYINGVRKKHLNAFNYFAISATVSSFFVFVYLKYFPETFKKVTHTYDTNGNMGDFVESLTRTLYEHQSLMLFLSIPLMAFVSKVVFYNYPKYNYVEHLVVYLYGYSHAILVFTTLMFLTVSFESVFLPIVTYGTFFYIVFVAYVLKRVFELSIKNLILKLLLFLAFGFALYIVIVVMVLILMFAFSYFNGTLPELMETFRPKK